MIVRGPVTSSAYPGRFQPLFEADRRDRPVRGSRGPFYSVNAIGLGTYPIIAGIGVGGVGRDEVAHPAEQAARADL